MTDVFPITIHYRVHELATAVGIEGQTVRRNAPTIYNVALAKRLFHDARETSLEQQVWGPLLASNEMGNKSVGVVIEKIKSFSDYNKLFEAAFNGKGPTSFTCEFLNESMRAISEQAQQGFKLFSGKARCTSCHVIKQQHALFTDHKLHNTGIGYQHSMQPDPEQRQVWVAPGRQLTVDGNVVAEASEKKPNDLGYYEITENPDDRWKYKTPTLRNIALTAPYMHNGSLSTLREVIEFYNNGGVKNELLDPFIQTLNLSNTEIDNLVKFLHTLTGDNITEITGDAFTVPIGNPTRSH